MKSRILPTARFIGSTVLLLILCGDIFAGENVPDWLAGNPDIQEHPQRAQLYEQVLSHAERKLQIKLAGNELARKRLVNAVNKAVDHWEIHKLEEYKANLRYLIIDGDIPLHYQFRLSNIVIEKYKRK